MHGQGYETHGKYVFANIVDLLKNISTDNAKQDFNGLAGRDVQ